MIEVMVENVPYWVRTQAARVANAFEKEFPFESDHDIYTLMDSVEVLLYGFGGDRETALALIAHYGWSDALIGGVDQEDSPIEKFKTEVCDLAKEYLYERGIYISMSNASTLIRRDA